MANVLYPTAKKKFLDADIDLLVDDIKVVLVDTGDYTFSTAHEFLSDVAGAGRVATSANLGTKSTTGGVFDAGDTSFASVTGDQSEALIIYKDTTVAGTSALIAYLDTATGLAVTPDGNNITVTWDNGASKIFAL